ncbi:MAG: sulfite exporter TauE/SafE family protein [Myxococcales bacterium]|nr:sulfite exporter TauE/SafE family protein [Myxococcales bacterium]
MSFGLATLLTLVALATSTLSAVTGVAGGVVLLSILLLTVPARAVVPLHGAVQLAASASRIVVFWRHMRWRVVLGFGVASALGAVAAAPVVSAMPARLMKGLVAGFILVSVALMLRKPHAQTSDDDKASAADAIDSAPPPSRGRALLWLSSMGLASGFLGMLVGSTGPLVSQAFLYAGIVSEAHIASKSGCQAVVHALKIPVYGLGVRFQYGAYAPTIGAMSLASVVGTLVGRQLLSRLSQARFATITQLLLGAIAIKILVVDVMLA